VLICEQGLSRTGDLVRGESQRARFELTRLTSLLVHYRTSMASDDCGGSAEARKQFKKLRAVHGIAGLKQVRAFAFSIACIRLIACLFRLYCLFAFRLYCLFA
jgi:hypothetical protein